MDFSALSSFIEEDNGSGGYEDLLEFSEGGPVGEDMEDDEQPSVQYFAEGGEVEEASAILQRMPKPGRAAQMLQSFAEGGEVQKTPFPELLDISKQVNAAGAPVEKLATPTTAPASTPVSSQINIPTFQPAAPVPTGPNIITPTPAPLAGLGAPPSLTQPTTAPTTTARSLFEQINPATMAAMPTYTTPSFTPTVQTFNRPTLLTQEELQKAQPPLVRYEPSATYGGLQTYQGPLQTSPYADIPNAPTGGTVAPPPPPAPPPNVTPGGYTFATYTTLTPEQLSGVGDKAQVTEAYKGIVTRQQADATAVRNEYNKALAEGNMAMVEQLKPLLVEQEAEFARAKADQAFVNKYFTGVGGAFETPEQYRQRMQEAQFKAQTITGLTGATDIAGLGVPVGTKADPYTTAVTQQTKEYNAALNTYNQLKAAYGDIDFVKNYFNEVVAPQKADVDALTVGTQATALKAGATAAFNAITAGQAYKVAAPTLAEFRNEQQTITAFAPAIKTYETNISTLTKARDAAANTGLTGYASRLDELLQSETDKYTQTLGQRQSAIDAAQPDPMRDYILGKQMVAQKIDGFVPVDVGGIDFSKMNAALFDPEIARQNKDLTAATNTYNQLVALYGNKSDIAVNFFNDVLTPQKNEVTQATALKTAAAAAIGSFNAGKAFPKYTRPAITVNKSTTDAAINKTFDPLIATYNKNIATLDAAKTRAQQAGLDQYTPYFDSLIENEYVKISQADQDRSNYIDAIPRAMGSPPEGEVADTRSRALLKKLSGGSEANTVPLQKFNKGGAVNKAQGSPIYGEIPDSGPITADTRAAFKAKGPSASSVVSDAAKLLRNITGEGVSNLESRIRGSVAAIPGSVGDIESIFRESDKTRRFATTEEVLRDYMPGRLTKPTKEAKGFEEVGSYLPLAIPAGTVTKTAGAVKTGARKALEELGPTAGNILERAVPKFGIVPEGPSAPTNLAQRVEQGKFFKGRLDDFVSQVRNPVTKQQFLGSLKGRFREYEISRAAQALADLDDAAKLTPTDLVSRISAVATPNRYKTTFIEPKDSGLHNRFDNVYGATGQPVGVINLAYEPTRAAVEAEEASAAARSAAAGLGRGTGDPEKIQTLTSFLETSQELAKAPERKAQLIAGLNNLSDQLSTARAEIAPVAQGITDIVFGNIPEYKGYFDRLREATKGISFPRNTPEYEEAFKNIDEQLKGEIKIQALQRLYQEQPSLRTFLPLKEGETFDELVKGLGGTKYVAEELLPRMRKNLYERLDDTSKAILVDNKALLDDVLRETQRYSTYKGSHTAVNPEKNAMGFSRFTEHQVNVPGLGKLDGIYVSELQSDMFRDIKKLGKKGGSAAKDREEMTSLFNGIKTRLDPLKQQIEDRFGSMDSFMFVLRGDMTNKADPAEFSNFLTTLGPISQGKADQIATDTIKDVKRITKLQERLGLPGGQVKGTYDIEEPIANIEVQPQVVQQLLAKNAIAGAMKMGKDFVAFPGVESKQAKLYEKLPRNLDAVLKDLGEGFVKQPITIKDATGTERQHWAVIWDKNAAQRVLNQGVPFKKGGLVEKSAMNNRRYI